ncbi:MAG TPA: hypothetical protein RMG48_03415 [Myxococcales bacterium LLY-WYZ-16_1]|nr:hypothetical protein [Myxococcales bacterium LLY-WYZ-16_1]
MLRIGDGEPEAEADAFAAPLDGVVPMSGFETGCRPPSRIVGLPTRS